MGPIILSANCGAVRSARPARFIGLDVRTVLVCTAEVNFRGMSVLFGALDSRYRLLYPPALDPPAPNSS